MIADVVDVPDPPKNVNYGDGLYMVNVNIVSVVKGIIPLGRAKIWTIYPVEKEKRYAFTTQRGQIAGTDVMAAIPQLSVVQVDMDLKNLENKSSTARQSPINSSDTTPPPQIQNLRPGEEDLKLFKHPRIPHSKASIANPRTTIINPKLTRPRRP